MTRILSKISLYDILAMIVPGSVVLMGLGMFDPICEKANDLPFIMYFGIEGHTFWTVTGTIFFLTIAYVIGIMIQAMNVGLIHVLYRGWNIDYVHSYICNKINTKRTDLFALTQPTQQIEDKKAKEDAEMSAYYTAYNYAIVFNPHTALLDLEKQIAMMRNVSIAIFPLCMALFDRACICGIFLWILCAGVILFFMSLRMKKAVELVFEEYETIKQLKLDENK